MNKQIIFLIIILFITKNTLSLCPNCNITTNCNNQVCTCFSDITNGFWTNSTTNPFKCDICQPNYDSSKKCKSCLPFYDENTKCKNCLKNYDPAKKCSTCLPNFNPQKACLECLPGRFGNDCSQTCDPNQTCHGNGVCNNDGTCKCFNDNLQGHWDPTTNCSKCVTGYTLETRCISGICSTNCSFSLSGYSRGSCVGPNVCECSSFFGGKECELNLCYGVLSNDKKNVCSGAGKCVDFNYCECDEGYRGRDCSDVVRAETLWVGLIVLMSLAMFTIIGFFILMAIVFSRKPEFRGRDGSWAQLNEDEIVDSNALGVDEEN